MQVIARTWLCAARILVLAWMSVQQDSTYAFSPSRLLMVFLPDFPIFQAIRGPARY